MPDDGPSFDEIKDAMMPPGTDKDALWEALKGAHRTGGHVPGQQAPDISGTLPPDLARHLMGIHDAVPAYPGPPPDPFTKGSEAAGAFAEMYEDLLGAGVPLASVERILGAMLAVYGLMTKDGP